MAKARVRPEDARRRLVEATVDFLSRRGVGDVSLRELAQGIGTSHRMLLYHFGSKGSLLVEVARATEDRQRRALAATLTEPGGSLDELTRRFWRGLRAPELGRLERLFFELYGRGLGGDAEAARLLEGVVDSWIAPLLPAVIAAGTTEDQARVVLRLSLAVTRGLLLDVLATGDGPAVDAAYELHLTALAALRERLGSRSAQAAGATRSPRRTAPGRTTSA